MRRAVAGLSALGLLLALAAPAEAARIRQRVVELRPDGDGLVQSERLEVLIENDADAREWRRYPIVVDDGRVDLEAVDLEVVDAAGKTVERVPRRKLEEGGALRLSGELFSSRRLLVARFDELAPRRSLRLDVTTRERPVYPGLTLVLELGEPQDRLRVRVAPGFENLRWRLSGDEQRFVVRRLGDGGLELVAEGVERYDPPAHAASTGRALLMLAWGAEREWADVGRWYESFARAAEPAPEITALAARLTQGLASPRAKAAALADYVQRRVRYEAVQIGEGGWRPSPAPEVMSRGWGDCKDKSRLLLDLLAAVGIDGHMALLRVLEGGHVDPEFPTAFQFNHAIVALPAAQLGPEPAAPAEAASGTADETATPALAPPVSGGLLWIDPTAPTGGLDWLLPSSRDRWALVVDGSASRLVRTPRQEGSERLRLELSGAVDEGGGFAGELRLALSGARALWWLERAEEGQQRRLRTSFDDFLKNWWPGANAGELRWERPPGPAPAIVLTTEVESDALVRGDPGRRWLRPPALDAFPDPRHLDGRARPVALDPGRWATRWDLALPADWCPAESADHELDSPIGRFAERVATVDGRLRLEREAELTRDLAEGEAIAELAELAVAESRSTRRRIRLRCAEGSSAG